MEERRRIVVDTGPVIALASVGCLPLLESLFHVIVPKAVIQELVGGAERIDAEATVRKLRRFAENGEPLDVDPMLAVELDAGEAAVIQTARNLRVPLVLIDERKARRLAREVFGLQTIGTARVLVLAKQRGLLTAVAPVLEEMKAGGYWIADEIVAWAEEAAGE